MNHSFLFSMLFMLSIFGLLSWCNGQCTAGQFLNGSNECIECPPGSYMDKIKHSNKRCIDCATLEGPLYEVQHPCNSTHNTVFRCAPDSFNTNGQELICQECRVCEHVVRNCTAVGDAICCPYGDMILQELMDNGTCETESLVNDKYCCIVNTPSYSTTSTRSIQPFAVSESISFATEINKNSSYITMSSAQLNTSFGSDSNTNSSNSDNEKISVGIIIAISIVCPIVIGLLVVSLVVIKNVIGRRTRNNQDQNIDKKDDNAGKPFIDNHQDNTKF